jgi:translation initiation factor IF-2
LVSTCSPIRLPVDGGHWGVSIQLYEIIYRLIEDVEKALKGMLDRNSIETIVSHADVCRIPHFEIGNIAGCRVVDGGSVAVGRVLSRKSIHGSEISSLKHLQDDVEFVQGSNAG